MKYTFITIFWGQPFLDYFNQFCLPSLLAPDNLPVWPWLKESCFVCYCPELESKKLQQSRIWQHLTQLMQAEVQPLPVTIPPPNQAETYKYHFKSECAQTAIMNCRQNQSSIIFIVPDVFYANGFFSALADLIEHGQEYIFHIGPRIKEEVTADLESFRVGNTLNIAPETAVSLMLKYMEVDYQSSFWLSPKFNWTYPLLTFYWKNSQDLACQSFLAEPLYLKEPQPFAAGKPYLTMDNVYLKQYQTYILEQGRPAMVVGGNPMVALSISPNNFYETSDWFQPATSAERQLQTYFHKVNFYAPIHHWMFTQTVVFHTAHSLPAVPWTAREYQNEHQLLLKDAPWELPLLTVTIEDLFLKNNYNAVVDIWQNPKTQNILKALTTPFLSISFYCIAISLCHVSPWNECVDFVQTYRLQLLAAKDNYTRVKRPYPFYSGGGTSAGISAARTRQHLQLARQPIETPRPNRTYISPRNQNLFYLQEYNQPQQLYAPYALFNLVSHAVSIQVEPDARSTFALWLMWALLEEKNIELS